MTLSLRLVVVGVLAAVMAADWPQLLGPSRNGTSTETNLVDGWPKAGPEVVWQRSVGEGFASPVVASGRLILFHHIGGSDLVESLDAATGKGGWKYSYASSNQAPLSKTGGPLSSPVVAAGKVFTLGVAGHLHCLDLATGRKHWSRDLAPEYGTEVGFFGIGTTPIVVGKLLLVNVGGQNAGIVAFDRDTGKEVWKATSQEASYSSPIAATVEGVRHVFFFTREGLVSVDPASGKVRFTRRFRARINASVNAAMPVLLGGDHLFLSASYDTGAVLLKVKEGSVDEVWRNRTSLSAHFSTPVPVGDQLYGFEGRQEAGAMLRCIDWKTGQGRWTQPGYGCGSLVAAGKKLFVLSEFGDLVLLEANPDRYTEKARSAVLGRPCRAHLSLANGLLYGRDNRRLVCWKVKKD